MNANVITVSLQKGVAKSSAELLKVVDNDIHRGKVGVGINGMAQV